MKGLLFLLALGAVGALSVFGFDVLGGSSKSAETDRYADAVFQVERGELTITVVENGYLKAKDSETLQPKYQGQNTITWLVDEGTEVAEGDVLVEFDATELENDLEESRNRLIQYEAELEAAQANQAIQSRENEAAIEKAQLALEIAELTLTRYEEGEYPNTLRKNELAVEKTQSELTRADEAFKQVPMLLEEGFLTKTQAEEEKIRLKEAEINLENATKELDLYRKYTQPMEQKQKEAAVRDAERDLETARERAKINLKEKEARVSQHNRHVQSTKARIEEYEKNLDYMKLVAPTPGVVLYGDPNNRWMVNEIKVGNTIWPGMTVITLPDLTEMQVLIDVHEADVDLVKEGQRCTITLETHKGKIFHGEVTDVASVATSSNWGDATNKQFRVEVSLENLEVELRAGITAKVEIEVDELPDVVFVPIHAIHQDGDEFVCFQPTATGFERTVVTLGKSNDHYVEVESGLEEGESVLLYDPREEGGGQADEAEETPTPAESLGDAAE